MKIQVYQDRKGEWRWRLLALNGRIVADGSEGYANKGDVLDAIEKIQAQIGDAPIDVLPTISS